MVPAQLSGMDDSESLNLNITTFRAFYHDYAKSVGPLVPSLCSVG
jgi:hypothetical protein